MGFYFTSHTKIKYKWIKDLNIRPETIKALEEHIGGKLHDIDLGNDFILVMTPKVQATQQKMKWDYIE